MDVRNDMTFPADLQKHEKGTGPLRSQRPIYVDFMPPCNSACPAGENIQGWLDKAVKEDYFGAFQVIMEDCPFPAVMGRICVRPCETGCNRNHIDTTVNIHAVERYIGDEAIRQNWQVMAGDVPPTGKRVLVVGAGPAGLSAAYHLARAGHTVEVYEADSHAGGLLWSGIPEYRLPKDILEAEIKRIENMGVTIHLNRRVEDILKEKTEGNFDAVFLGIGAQKVQPATYTHDGSINITDAFNFFETYRENTEVYANKRVAIYGGGKISMYLARIIKRLGSEVSVLYEGDQKMMPAYDYETEDALSEGVDVQLFRKINKVENGNMVVEVMEVVKNKAIGTGQFMNVPVDVIIMADKQQSESNFLRQLDGLGFKDDGTVVVDAQRMTGFTGIFAGGDMLPGENRSSTIAIGQGKKAAKYIHGYLIGIPYQKPPKHATASYKKLHIWYKTDAPQKEQDRLAPQVAIQNFDEVIAPLNREEAHFEANRCLSCGNCFECDGCYGACPEAAILKLGTGLRYEFIYEKCTGCAVCYEQCPCHAIEMIPEPSPALASSPLSSIIA